jgi:hypothetical protein
MVIRQVPDEMIKAWSHHPEFGSEFRALVDTHNAEFSAAAAKMANGEVVHHTPMKRAIGESPTSVEKKARLNTEALIDVANLPGVEMLSVPLVSIKMPVGSTGGVLFLSLRVGHKLYAVNPSDNDVRVRAGSLLAGLGKIGFRTIGEDESFDQDKDVPFSPTGSAVPIFLDNQLTTIGKAVQDRVAQKSKEEAKICYHSQEEIAGGDVGEFRLVQTLKVVCRPKAAGEQEVEGKVSQQSVGARIPLTVFHSSPLLAIIWACKWHVNGLMPVRAQVCFSTTADVMIPAGKALLLTG